jgi:hypothetical protein
MVWVRDTLTISDSDADNLSGGAVRLRAAGCFAAKMDNLRVLDLEANGLRKVPTGCLIVGHSKSQISTIIFTSRLSALCADRRLPR